MAVDQTTSTAVVVDNRTFAERFTANAQAKLKSASTYVVPIGGVLLGILVEFWKSMDAGQQGAIISSAGVSQAWSAIAILVIGHLAAVFKPAPAGSVSPQMQELLEQIARLKLNEKLVSMGQAALPVPTSALTATPNVHIVVAGATQAPADPDGLGAALAHDQAHGYTDHEDDFPPTQFAPSEVVDVTATPAPAPSSTPVVQDLKAIQFAGEVVSLAKLSNPAMTEQQQASLRQAVLAKAKVVMQ